MFLVGSTRIFTKQERVDLVDFAGNSVIRHIISGRALHLIDGLLGADLSRRVSLDPLRLMLFACVPLLGDEEHLHFDRSLLKSLIGLPSQRR